MTLLDDFNVVIKRENMFSTTDHLLLAVSGGLDSMVLCALCAATGFSFSLVHCNFQLRGAESDRDADFVKQAAEKYGVALHMKLFDTASYAAENRISIQEAARNLRYAWFESLIDEKKLAGIRAWVLTAHHRDDAIETSVMHFFRGTGLKGLLGIPAQNHYLRRPLLSFSRAQLAAYAEAEQLEWVEDSSNRESKYTRNFFRNEILPAVGTVYPQVMDNLAGNLQRFHGAWEIYQQGLLQLRRQLLKPEGAGFRLPVKQLAARQNTTLLHELLQPFGFSEGQAQEAQKLLQSASGHFITSANGSWKLIRHRHWLYLSPMVEEQGDALVYAIAEGEQHIQAGAMTLSLRQEARTGTAIPRLPATEACLDMRNIQFPLILRKWKPGDYFYPLGMPKKKKIARFLIDQRIPLHEKEKIWVLESGNRIIWVPGHRIDHRFRITSSTSWCLHLRISETP